MAQKRPSNLLSLRETLPIAEKRGYALGSFSPRYVSMIRPVLQTAERLRSPVIIQISSNEFNWYSTTAADFARKFFSEVASQNISIPVVLHLDHTRDMATIGEAIAAGFTSVMMDASKYPLEENIERTREAVRYATARGVSVEAELGRILSADAVETDEDRELYTDPDEAEYFINRTGADALAVSVGTAHGIYLVRRPAIDFERLRAIRTKTGVPLVLHGGSGVPADMVLRAIRLKPGGVSKVNIASDLEQSALGAIGRSERLSNEGMAALSPEELTAAGEAVATTVADKIRHFVASEGRADDPEWRRESFLEAPHEPA